MVQLDEFELFDREVRRYDWDQLRQASEDWRKDVPGLLVDLVHAETEADASDAYFRLEGGCFPQRLVTESCVAIVSCLLAMLAAKPPAFVVTWALEALRGILGGEPIQSEIQAGSESLMEDCRDAAKPGIWLLRGMISECPGPALKSLQRVLAEIDPDRQG